MRWGIYKGFLRRPGAALLNAHSEAAAKLASYGVNYHHKLPAAETVTADELKATLAALAGSGVTVGLHPLTPVSESLSWSLALSQVELSRLATVLTPNTPLDGCDLYLGHEVWRYLDRLRRNQLLDLVQSLTPRLTPRFYYGGPTKLWARQTEFGWDGPHIVHIAANHGSAADATAVYASPQALLAAIQAARDHMERTSWGTPSWYVHLNVRPDDPAAKMAAALRALARLKPDALIVRACNADGGSVDCGYNVLDAIRAAREGGDVDDGD